MYNYVIKACSAGQWTKVFGPEDITVVNQKFNELTKGRTTGTKYRDDPYYAMFRHIEEGPVAPVVDIPDPTISEGPE